MSTDIGLFIIGIAAILGVVSQLKMLKTPKAKTPVECGIDAAIGGALAVYLLFRAFGAL